MYNNHCTGLDRPFGFQKVEVPTFQDNRQMKVGKVVSPTHRPPLPPEVFLILISVRGWVDPRATARPEGSYQRNIPKNTIGNRTRNIPGYSTVPQSNTPQPAPRTRHNTVQILSEFETYFIWTRVFSIPNIPSKLSRSTSGSLSYRQSKLKQQNVTHQFIHLSAHVYFRLKVSSFGLNMGQAADWSLRCKMRASRLQTRYVTSSKLPSKFKRNHDDSWLP